MWKRRFCTLCVLAALVTLCAAAKPMGGKFKGAKRGVHMTLVHNMTTEEKTVRG